MATTARLAGIAGVTVAATALIAGPAAAAPKHQDEGGAAFVQSDNVAGNTIVAYARSAGGTLTETRTYGTGGLGCVLTGSVADHLASQGGLALDESRSHLYAVDAGSDTVTAFDVHGTLMIAHIAGAATLTPSTSNSPWDRRYPHVLFSPARRSSPTPTGQPSEQPADILLTGEQSRFTLAGR